MIMREIFVATSNAGKLREFSAISEEFGVVVAPIPDLASVSVPQEDAPTFESNACKKAEHYSHAVKDAYVLAEDSGLEVDALGGTPGVHSARYANESGPSGGNATDAANNERLLSELKDIAEEHRTARYVSCIAIGRNGRTVACFRGEVRGRILERPQGTGGFGYDPLFYLPEFKCSAAELTPADKGKISHRGKAFRKFLNWFVALPEEARTAPRAAG
jgi:XTP/dITP diphosphohydrolase